MNLEIRSQIMGRINYSLLHKKPENQLRQFHKKARMLNCQIMIFGFTGKKFKDNVYAICD